MSIFNNNEEEEFNNYLKSCTDDELIDLESPMLINQSK